LPRLLGRFDHGNDECLRADIQVLLDQLRRGVHGTHDGMNRIRRHRLQLPQHAARIVGRMLGIDYQTIEADGGQQFGGVGVGQSHPQPDLRLSLAQRPLESIGR